GRFFWDERAETLEDQVLMPIQNKVEMGHTLPKLIDHLASQPEYPPLFRAAFGDTRVSSNRASMALAQFVRSLVSYQSKYDEGVAKARVRSDDFPNFTREENRGKAVFFRACAICHMPGQQDAVFISPQAQNNGLDANAATSDLGRADVTLRPVDVGRFKSPSLRNIEYTGPYMHDGRFAKLEDVVEHYSTGLKRHPNLDGRLIGPAANGGGFRFSPGEKAALVAFLNTLSDPKFITDPKFSDPFKN
ncbi:MAG TPA: cytochrome c peroxidase, partial [Gemmataceae bacterium]|nr:cytochrome c peroxidase [Gemmataceae bacterium]